MSTDYIDKSDAVGYVIDNHYDEIKEYVLVKEKLNHVKFSLRCLISQTWLAKYSEKYKADIDTKIIVDALIHIYYVLLRGYRFGL